ncbi:MAG: hypothetical protein QM811_04070 [Pirellulales bacterium]
MRSEDTRFFEKQLRAILPRLNWFADEPRAVHSIRLNDVVILDDQADSWLALLLIDIRYESGDSQSYSTPVGLLGGRDLEEQATRLPEALLARIFDRRGDLVGLLRDATRIPERMNRFLESISSDVTTVGRSGTLKFWSTPELAAELSSLGGDTTPKPLETEPSNSTILFGDRLALKLLTKLEVGVDPELEIGRLLREQGTFDRIVPLRGAVEYVSTTGQSTTLALVEQYIPDSVSFKHHVSDRFQRFLEAWTANPPQLSTQPVAGTTVQDLLAASRLDAAAEILNLVGGFLDTAGLLGKRTAELHRALASLPGEDFRPIPASPTQMRSMYQTIRRSLVRSLQYFKQRRHELPPRVLQMAANLERYRPTLFRRLEILLERRDWGKQIRCHGDCHLSQILYDGRDLLFFDFEGVPGRPLVIRRGKASPLTDLASLLRSLHYAIHDSIRDPGFENRPESMTSLREGARFWYLWSASAILRAYFREIEVRYLLPSHQNDLDELLRIHVLQRGIFELEYELTHRPDRAEIPLYGLLSELRILPEEE